MKAGDWVKIVEGYWKGNEGEIFVGGERFAWIRLLDGEEVICLESQYEALPILGQIALNIQGSTPLPSTKEILRG